MVGAHLFFIPFVNLAILIVLGIDIAKRFGKGAGFGVGLACWDFCLPNSRLWRSDIRLWC